jgi:hypothetical protein
VRGIVYVPAFSGVSEPPDLVRTTGTGVFLPARLVRPRVPCVSCVSRLHPVSFYRHDLRTGNPEPTKRL